jgi:fumarate reductase subunit D
VSRPRANIARRNDARARAHPGWWAFWVHRVSGVLLALFLPVHLWALGRVLQGTDALDALLHATDRPLFKFAEWGLAVLLTAHLGCGLRLLAIEFGSWRGLRHTWIGWAAAASMGIGIVLAAVLLLPVG